MRGRAHLCILLECQHDFGCAVPPGSDVFCHESRLRAGGFCGLDGTRETKVTDLEIAVGVEKEVGRFEIPVDDVGGVEGFECTEGLVDEVLCVVVREVLCPDYTVHVCLHEFLNHCVEKSE
jgi:hypothetical protein